jgi:hypothetical protein
MLGFVRRVGSRAVTFALHDGVVLPRGARSSAWANVVMAHDAARRPRATCQTTARRIVGGPTMMDATADSLPQPPTAADGWLMTLTASAAIGLPSSPRG